MEVELRRAVLLAVEHEEVLALVGPVDLEVGTVVHELGLGRAERERQLRGVERLELERLAAVGDVDGGLGRHLGRHVVLLVGLLSLSSRWSCALAGGLESVNVPLPPARSQHERITSGSLHPPSPGE